MKHEVDQIDTQIPLLVKIRLGLKAIRTDLTIEESNKPGSTKVIRYDYYDQYLKNVEPINLTELGIFARIATSLKASKGVPIRDLNSYQASITGSEQLF